MLAPRRPLGRTARHVRTSDHRVRVAPVTPCPETLHLRAGGSGGAAFLVAGVITAALARARDRWRASAADRNAPPARRLASAERSERQGPATAQARVWGSVSSQQPCRKAIVGSAAGVGLWGRRWEVRHSSEPVAAGTAIQARWMASPRLVRCRWRRRSRGTRPVRARARMAKRKQHRPPLPSVLRERLGRRRALQSRPTKVRGAIRRPGFGRLRPARQHRRRQADLRDPRPVAQAWQTAPPMETRLTAVCADRCAWQARRFLAPTGRAEDRQYARAQARVLPPYYSRVRRRHPDRAALDRRTRRRRAMVRRLRNSRVQTIQVLGIARRRGRSQLEKRRARVASAVVLRLPPTRHRCTCDNAPCGPAVESPAPSCSVHHKTDRR